MSRSYSESEIERAIKETMDKVDSSGGPHAKGRFLFLKTPWHEEAFPMGSVFQAQTVTGHTNYVIFMMVDNGWAYYCHGDRAKKVPTAKFVELIGSGELEYIPKEKVDPERKSLAVLGLMAMANGLSFEDYMKVAFNEGNGSDAGRYGL